MSLRLAQRLTTKPILKILALMSQTAKPQCVIGNYPRITAWRMYVGLHKAEWPPLLNHAVRGLHPTLSVYSDMKLPI